MIALGTAARRLALAGLIVSAAACATPAPSASLDEEIIGAWRLVRTEQHLLDGSTRPNPAYGPDGIGYIIYDRSHTMCVFLTNPDRSAPAGGPRGAPGSSMSTPAAYCGGWRIEQGARVIVHVAEMDVFPDQVGVVRRRTFERRGDTLILHPTPLPEGLAGYDIVFERVTEQP